MLSASGAVAPFGGVVVLSVTGIAGGPLTTSRAFGSGAYTLIDSCPQPGGYTVVVDYGDGLQGPLPNDAGTYNYLIQDSATGVYVTGLVPVAQVEVDNDWLDETVMRCIQAGLANLVLTPAQQTQLPPGYKPPAVLFEMPRVGFPPLPFVFITPMTMRQAHTQIGQDVAPVYSTPGRQLQTNSVQVTRTWRHSIYARTASEREFYRDAVLGLWQVMLQSVLQPLASDLHHTFMVHSMQDSSGHDMQPGFYLADILYSVDGMFNVGIIPTYGVIEAVSIAMTGALGTISESFAGYGGITISGSGSGTGASGALFTTIVTG